MYEIPSNLSQQLQERQVLYKVRVLFVNSIEKPYKQVKNISNVEGRNGL